MSAPSPDELRAVAARIDAAPSVARRSAGLFGTAAAYLPGERIDGLRIRGERLEVHVMMRWGFTVSDVEREVLIAIGSTWPSTRVDLVVDDVELPDPSSRKRLPLDAAKPGR